MNSMTPISSTARPEAAHSAPIAAGNATPTDVAGTSRVLRNTYALLSMTLLSSAAWQSAVASMSCTKSSSASSCSSIVSGPDQGGQRGEVGRGLPAGQGDLRFQVAVAVQQDQP